MAKANSTGTTSKPTKPVVPTDPELRSVIAEADKVIAETAGMPAAPDSRSFSFDEDEIVHMQISLSGAAAVLSLCADHLDGEASDAVVLVEKSLRQVVARLDEGKLAGAQP